jgi:hypothetical protein
MDHLFRKNILIVKACTFFFLLSVGSQAQAAHSPVKAGPPFLLAASEMSPATDVTTAESGLGTDEWEEDWDGGEKIADPLEPLNRVFFHFNDKLYYWVLKPVARAYSFILPEGLRIAVSNFFDNLLSPGRAVNCLFQGEVKDSSVEIARFLLNSTAGSRVLWTWRLILYKLALFGAIQFQGFSWHGRRRIYASHYLIRFRLAGNCRIMDP